MHHVPFVSGEARCDVFIECEAGMAFDGDVIVVIEPAEILQLEMAGEGGSFAGNALQHVAVAADGVDLEVEHRKIGAIEMLREPIAGDSHADAVGDALAKRAGGGFDAGSPAVLGMAGAFAIELAETLDVFEFDGKFAEALVFWIDGFHSGEMKERIKQHGGVAIGEHEAITIGPNGIVRIKTQKLLPESIGNRR